MLTFAQRDEFEQWGVLRLSGAVPAAVADRMAERIWSFLVEDSGVERADPETWSPLRPTGFQPVSRAGELDAIWSPAVAGAVEDLLGSAGARRERPRVLMTFPDSTVTWTVPSAGWHFDYVPPHTEPGLRALQLFVVLNHVVPGGGGTAVLAGSHRLVAAYAGDTGNDPRPKAVRSALSAESPWLADLWSTPSTDGAHLTARTARLTEGTTVNGVAVRLVEATGEPGDVYLMHSDCFHAATPNTCSAARIMVTSVVTRVGSGLSA